MTTEQNRSYDVLRPLALLATGQTGADIERLVREVRRKTRREKRNITWTDLEQALLAGQLRMSDDLRWRTSVHEAGHAIAFTLTGIAEVLTATVGIEGVGQVSSRPNEHLAQTESWMMNFIACWLAGRTAEIIVFGEPAVGAGGSDDSDLARATRHATAAETRLGFSTHQPLVYHSERDSVSALSLDHNLTERVNARLLAAEQSAREMLEARRDELMAVATRLNEVGVMTGDEVRVMLNVQDG